MPDTGAPWNIPYVENADLVRDWPADSLLVANAIAAGLTAANTGIGSNVVQTVKTDTFTTSSATFTAITGFSVTITPTSNTSKILVVAFGSISNTSAFNGEHVRLMRGATPIFVGDAASGIVSATYGTSSSTGIVGAFTSVFLDSPATASAVTYSMEARRGTGGTLTFNRSGADSTEVHSRNAASITAIEVAV